MISEWTCNGRIIASLVWDPRKGAQLPNLESIDMKLEVIVQERHSHKAGKVITAIT